MKRLVSTLLIAFLAFIGFAQSISIQPKVDERTELLSIVFRLAEAEEYVNNDIVNYSKEIDEFFKPYAAHELIQFVKKLRRTSRVGFDAVMSMAVNLEIKDCIKLKENLSNESHDNRWSKKDIVKFIELLNVFYIETKFHDFFISHQSLYSRAESNYYEIIKVVDLPWFNSFFGITPNGSYNLILSLTNGRGCYGSKSSYNDGREDIFAIMGTWRVDSLGFPIYSERNVSTIIHEFNHSFCNQLIQPYYDSMEPQASRFYKLVSNKMAEQKYISSKTMLYEILVRACVVKYYQNKNISENKIRGMINDEKSRGFIWIEELINILAKYEEQRDKYPTLNDFMPEIVKLQNSLSPKILLADFESKSARIVSSNIKNGSKSVDPTISVLTLQFDKPMDTGFNGTSYGKKGEKFFPDFPKDVKFQWNETTKLEWSISIILKPNTEYSISFPAQFFRDEKGYLLRETYYLDFKTKQ